MFSLVTWYDIYRAWVSFAFLIWIISLYLMGKIQISLLGGARAACFSLITFIFACLLGRVHE
jgi:hypothetical protein